jgi:hypothetical protein
MNPLVSVAMGVDIRHIEALKGNPSAESLHDFQTIF